MQVQLDLVHTGDEESRSSREFREASNEFLTQLAAVPSLEVRIPEVPVEGTRGVISSLTGIVVWAAKSGAFSALDNLAKELYARYASCEVQLKFEDGSVLILKNLTQQQAEERIAVHLARTVK
jgi:hypothetical protein